MNPVEAYKRRQQEKSSSMCFRICACHQEITTLMMLDMTISFQSFHHSHSRGHYDSKPNNAMEISQKKMDHTKFAKKLKKLGYIPGTPPPPQKKKKTTGNGSHLWMFRPASERSHCRAASTGLTDLGKKTLGGLGIFWGGLYY